jgi:hypothetical protein
MKRINSITIKTEYDESPDLSYLGEITETKQYDLQKHMLSIPTDPDDMNNTKWYIPENHLPHKEENWKTTPQEFKDQAIAKYGSLRKADIAYAYDDHTRLQDYYAGKWWMEGIIVTAKIEISEDGKNWAHDEVIASLWGIESNSDKEYRENIIADLKSEVAHDLKIWGFSNSDITVALADAKAIR